MSITYMKLDYKLSGFDWYNRQMKIKKYFSKLNALFISVIFVFVITIIIPHFNIPNHAEYNTIKTDFNALSIPLQLKEYLRTKQGSELNLIYFDGKNLQYHESIDHDLFMQIYLQAMRELAINKNLNPGYYLISFRDGVHEDFGWPVLAFASSKHLVEAHKVFLIPDPEAMQGYESLFKKIDAQIDAFPWHKKQAKLFWRGVASGTKYNNTDINGSPRLRFMNHAKDLPFADVGFTGNPLFFDDQFRAQFETAYPLKDTVPPEASLAYKYLIDVDGISCSFSRMAWILYSNSVLMKHTSDKIQWYYDQLRPYVNFIPIAEDFNNLQQQYTWAEKHQTETQQIALQGRELASKVFAKENILETFKTALWEYQGSGTGN